MVNTWDKTSKGKCLENLGQDKGTSAPLGQKRWSLKRWFFGLKPIDMAGSLRIFY
jgi:hypothetical protein